MTGLPNLKSGTCCFPFCSNMFCCWVTFIYRVSVLLILHHSWSFSHHAWLFKVLVHDSQNKLRKFNFFIITNLIHKFLVHSHKLHKIKFLYMFWAQSAHHQEVNDANCTYAAPGIVTLCKWPFCATSKEGLAKQAKQIFQYKNIKIKLYKNNAAIWYNKTCRIKQLIPTYINIK